MNLRTHIEKSYSILDRAYYEHTPTAIIAMTSGGHDSQSCTQVVYEWCEERGLLDKFRAVAMDTGVAADGWSDWIIRNSPWPVTIWQSPEFGFQWYADNAIEYGFGYTKTFHTEFYFRMLKERTARKVIQHYKDHSKRTNRVMLTWGIFAQESPDRVNSPEIERNGAAVNVNPVLHWTPELIAKMRIDRELPDNPYYGTVGGSGDCQCNWGRFISLDKLNEHSPKLALKIAILNREVIKRHGWGWGEKPSEGLLQERSGQMTLPGIAPLVDNDLCIPNLCEGCKRQKPGHNESLDEIMTQRMEW